MRRIFTDKDVFKLGRKPRIEKSKEYYDKQAKKEAFDKLTFEEQRAYMMDDYMKTHRKSIDEHLKELSEPNRRSHEETLTKAKLAIEMLIANGFKVTPTNVANQSGISRSYIYKCDEIKKMIDDCKEHNERVKHNTELKKKYKLTAPTYSVDQTVLNYQLHMKLMESYVHQYQLLKAQNKYMEEKIEELKNKAANK